jgi:hypothetical protein
MEDLNGINNGSNQLPPSQFATSLKGKKWKAPMDDFERNIYQRKKMFLREFESTREAILDVAHVIREGNVTAERGRPRVYAEQEVFTELVKIGVDVHLLYKAYTFLITHLGLSLVDVHFLVLMCTCSKCMYYSFRFLSILT